MNVFCTVYNVRGFEDLLNASHCDRMDETGVIDETQYTNSIKETKHTKPKVKKRLNASCCTSA